MNMQNRYRMRGVLFDTSSDCSNLRKRLQDKGIISDVLIVGLEEEQSMKRAIHSLGISAVDVLLITNSKKHAETAEKMGVVCVGTMEGLSELPKVTTLLESPGEASVDYLELLYCHERKLPAIVLETERCYLKEMTLKDFPQLYAIYQKPEITRYLSESMTNQEEEQEKLKAYITWTYSFFGFGYWGVFEKDTNRLIGRAGFEAGSEPLEVGYLINVDDWGKGYATEILNSLLQYAQEELGYSEIIARIKKDNTISCHVAERCGMIKEERTKEDSCYLYYLRKTKAQDEVSA